MAANDIKEKLQNIVENGDFASTEMGVVYFLVEIRKLIEMKAFDTSGLAKLKFYCDWIVHTKKDRTLKPINVFLDSLAREIQNEPNETWKKFITFEDLKKEILQIAVYRELELNTEKIEKHFKLFKKRLGQVLVRQPIITEDHYIAEVKIADIREIILLLHIQTREVKLTLHKYVCRYDKGTYIIE